MEKHSMKAMKHMDNEMAVSPIVATLVLIVVAVVGAVAVGTIMGTFSSDVSKQTKASDASDASSTHILIAGSTTVLPASQILASSYMKLHPGIKIDVQGGGSAAGMAAAGQGIADIGAASSAGDVTTGQASYPDLVPYQIGARSVVWIVNKNNPGTGVTASDLATFVKQTSATNLTLSGTGAIGINTLVQRSDASGTESTAAKWVNAGSPYSGDNAFDTMLAADTKAVSGNAGILAEINGNTAGNEIGFVDLGYVYDTTGTLKSTANNVVVLSVTDSAGTYTYSNGAKLRAMCLQSVKDMMKGTAQVAGGADTNYPQKLDSPLYYVTLGQPNSVVADFINYARSPNGGTDVQNAGDFSLLEVS